MHWRVCVCALSKSLNPSQFLRTKSSHGAVAGLQRWDHRAEPAAHAQLINPAIAQHESTAASPEKMPQMLPVQTGLEQFGFVGISVCIFKSVLVFPSFSIATCRSLCIQSMLFSFTTKLISSSVDAPSISRVKN